MDSEIIDDDINKIIKLDLELDINLCKKFQKFLLLEQCINLFNNDTYKMQQIFNILDKFNITDICINKLTDFFAIYLYIASEQNTDLHKIVFEYIKNNKFNISFEQINNCGGYDVDVINEYVYNNIKQNKNVYKLEQSCSYNHLSCITNLIRDNKIDGLQLYHDNNLIKEDYFDDIKDSLIVFKCNINTLNFFNNIIN